MAGSAKGSRRRRGWHSGSSNSFLRVPSVKNVHGSTDRGYRNQPHLFPRRNSSPVRSTLAAEIAHFPANRSIVCQTVAVHSRPPDGVSGGWTDDRESTPPRMHGRNSHRGLGARRIGVAVRPALTRTSFRGTAAAAGRLPRAPAPDAVRAGGLRNAAAVASGIAGSSRRASSHGRYANGSLFLGARK